MCFFKGVNWQKARWSLTPPGFLYFPFFFNKQKVILRETTEIERPFIRWDAEEKQECWVNADTWRWPARARDITDKLDPQSIEDLGLPFPTRCGSEPRWDGRSYQCQTHRIRTTSDQKLPPVLLLFPQGNEVLPSSKYFNGPSLMMDQL